MSEFSIGKPDMARRAVLKRGALVFGFSLLPAAARAEFNAMGLPPLAHPRLAGSLKNTPMLDAWIRVAASGKVTVCSGKVELGTGLRTALTQIALEQLELEPADIRFIGGDTSLTPNEGFTAGSHSVADSGSALLHASAQVALLLRHGACAQWNLPLEQVSLRAGRAVATGGRSMHYGEALRGLRGPGLHRLAAETSPLRDPAHYRLIGKAVPRVDIPAKVSGGAAYVQDMRLSGMLHARVVRPPRPGARLARADLDAVRRLPGVRKVVRDGSYLAVLAEDEWRAIGAMNALAELAKLPLGRVRCIHTEGSGCYGQNGADDVAADAALLACAMPGIPVRVQLMRDQENLWEPYAPASWCRPGCWPGRSCPRPRCRCRSRRAAATAMRFHCTTSRMRGW